MSFLLKLFKKIRSANVTIAGLENAGKTAFVNYLIDGSFTDTVPTAGVNREVINLPKLQLNIYDLGGQEKFRVLWPDINEKSDGLIYVIDSNDLERFDFSSEILYNILETQVNDLIPVLILLHKFDLPDKLSISEFLQKISLSKYNVKWACFETSAITGEGIYNAMNWFINEMEEQN